MIREADPDRARALAGSVIRRIDESSAFPSWRTQAGDHELDSAARQLFRIAPRHAVWLDEQLACEREVQQPDDLGGMRDVEVAAHPPRGRGAVREPQLRQDDRASPVLDDKEKVGFDWAWEAGDDRANRKFKIVETSPSLLSKEVLADERFRTWSTEFAAALLGKEVEFWYGQFLAEPPREGARTPWHQDEGY